MLKIFVETIADKDVSIQEFIPEILDKKWIEDSLIADYKKINFFYPEDSKAERLYSKKRGIESKELQCTFKEIIMGDDILVGYSLAICEMGKSLMTIREKTNDSIRKNLAKIEWIFDKEKSLFTRVSLEGTGNDEQDLDVSFDLGSKITNTRSKYMSNMKRSKFLLPDDADDLRGVSIFAKLAMAHGIPWDKPNYAKKIITKQITPYGGFNKIPKKVLAEKQKDIIREAEERDIQSKGDTKKEQQSMNMTLKSRRDLINAIQNGKTLSSICNLHILSLIILLVIIIMSTVDFCLFDSKYKNIVSHTELFANSLDLETQMIQGIENIRTLILLSDGIIEDTHCEGLACERYENVDAYRDGIKNELIKIQSKIDNIQKEISNMANDFENLKEVTLNNRDLLIEYKTNAGVDNSDTSKSYYNLIESINMVNSHIFSIAVSDTTNLKDYNEHVFFVFTNGLNVVFNKIDSITIAMIDDMDDYSSSALNSLKIVLIVAVCIIFLLNLLLIPLLRSIQTTQEEILMLFFQIKRGHAKGFAKQCQQFYNSLQKKRTRQNAGSDSEGSDKEMDDSERGNDDDDYDPDNEGTERIIGSGTRKLKKSSMNLSSTIFWEILLNILISSYFIVNYIMLGDILFSASDSLNLSLKQIGHLNTVHYISYIGIREALYNSNFKLEYKTPLEYSTMIIYNLTDVHSYIEKSFELDKYKIRLYYGEFTEEINYYFDNSICTSSRNNYFYENEEKECTEFAEGIGAQVWYI